MSPNEESSRSEQERGDTGNISDPEHKRRVGEPRVSIVILSYNNWERTEQCLHSLADLDYSNYHLLVVDNGSAEPCPPHLLKDFPRIEFFANHSNLGFAGGCNSGIRHVKGGNPKYVWLLNNDTMPESGSLAAMVGLAESDSRLGAVGSLLLNPDAGGSVQARGGGKISFFVGLPAPSRPETPTRLDFLCGASLLIRTKALEEVGLLDPRFFLYWEDTDLCFRLRAGGWKLGVAERSRVIHAVSSSSVFQSSSWDYHFTASSVRFFRLHCRLWAWPVLFSVAGRIVMRLLRRKTANAAAVWRGFRDGLQAGPCPKDG